MILSNKKYLKARIVLFLNIYKAKMAGFNFLKVQSYHEHVAGKSWTFNIVQKTRFFLKRNKEIFYLGLQNEEFLLKLPRRIFDRLR